MKTMYNNKTYANIMFIVDGVNFYSNSSAFKESSQLVELLNSDKQTTDIKTVHISGISVDEFRETLKYCHNLDINPDVFNETKNPIKLFDSFDMMELNKLKEQIIYMMLSENKLSLTTDNTSELIKHVSSITNNTKIFKMFVILLSDKQLVEEYMNSIKNIDDIPESNEIVILNVLIMLQLDDLVLKYIDSPFIKNKWNQKGQNDIIPSELIMMYFELQTIKHILTTNAEIRDNIVNGDNDFLIYASLNITDSAYDVFMYILSLNPLSIHKFHKSNKEIFSKMSNMNVILTIFKFKPELITRSIIISIINGKLSKEHIHSFVESIILIYDKIGVKMPRKMRKLLAKSKLHLSIPTEDLDDITDDVSVIDTYDEPNNETDTLAELMKALHINDPGQIVKLLTDASAH